MSRDWVDLSYPLSIWAIAQFIRVFVNFVHVHCILKDTQNNNYSEYRLWVRRMVTNMNPAQRAE